MVPAEGIEPPTFGLQNRCSTAELSRPSVANTTFFLSIKREHGTTDCLPDARPAKW